MVNLSFPQVEDSPVQGVTGAQVAPGRWLGQRQGGGMP